MGAPSRRRPRLHCQSPEPSSNPVGTNERVVRLIKLGQAIAAAKHGLLGSLGALVDGVGSFRTHAGSAHGRGRKAYKVDARLARLAVHSAHTLTLFVIETWQLRRAGK